MTYPNTLVFVDYPSDDVNVARAFYARGLQLGSRRSHRGHVCPHRSGTELQARRRDARPDRQPAHGPVQRCRCTASPAERPRRPDRVEVGRGGIRAWILVSDDDSVDRILEAAERLGGTVLWRDHFWTEFGGANASFIDPWGNQLMLWQHLPGAETDDDTHQVVGEFSLPQGWTYE